MGLVQVASNAQLEKMEAEENKSIAAYYTKEQPVLQSLAAHLRVLWERAQRAKQPYEARFFKAKRQRKGEYSQQQLMAIRALHGDDYIPVYMMISGTKCRAGESWIKDIIFQPGVLPWDIKPTPMPELPEVVERELEAGVFNRIFMEMMEMSMMTGQAFSADELLSSMDQMMPQVRTELNRAIKEKAVEAAENMKTKIDDQFKEGGWYKAVGQEIYDIVTFGTCIHKGPTVAKEWARIMHLNPLDGTFNAGVEERLLPKHKRVNPFMGYPGPDNIGTEDGFMFELLSLSRKEVSDLIGLEGFDENALRAVLSEHNSAGLVEQTTMGSEKAELEGRNDTSRHGTDKIDCLEFWGSAPGRTLIEWGLSGNEITDAQREYNVAAWMIGNHVIKAIVNPDPLGSTPYSKSCFEEDPDSFWGKGIPELITYTQSIANATARALVNNVGIASGPQVEVNTDRQAAGTDYSIHPWKVWLTNNQGIQEGKAVNFYQPNMVVDKLMAVYQWCSAVADEESGVPRYAHGDTTVEGAGETASGLSMLMTQAARGIKNVIKNIDDGVITNSVMKQYHYNLDYLDDIPQMIGDAKVYATGSSSLIAKEQQAVRRREFLINTNNPVDVQITGLTGRRELLYQSLKSLELDPEKILKDAKELAAMEQAQQAQLMAPPEGSQELDAAGNPVAGTDFDLNQAPKGETNQ